MSLRTTKLGLLRSGITNYKSGVSRYSTKTKSLEPQVVLYIGSDNPHPRNEHLNPNLKFPFPGFVARTELLRTQTDDRATSKAAKQSVSRIKKAGKVPLKTAVIMALKKMNIQTVPDYKPEAQALITKMKLSRDVELKAIECPRVIREDLKYLFVNVNLTGREVVVFNLTQKSTHNMSAWSPEMENERDELTKGFIEVASAICKDLRNLGDGKYWADFIDPSSGRPYFGGFTNVSLFETDERYRDLGFKIEDLGCCKVLKHVKWSSHAFVGTIFTDAPLYSEEVQHIISIAEDGKYYETTESGSKNSSETPQLVAKPEESVVFEPKITIETSQEVKMHEPKSLGLHIAKTTPKVAVKKSELKLKIDEDEKL